MRDGQSHHGGLSFHQLALHLHRQQQEQQPQQRAQTRSRAGRLTGAGGEIVEVQGGHIVRSTGRKDRHSKVCTAKGPRDRRVRLAAHTAIQFYDVQDRLGYDRPSKAVDWLIKNAKAAIDQLAELPAWMPTATSASGATPPAGHSPAAEQPSEELGKKQIMVDEPAATAAFSFDGSDGSGGDGSGGNSFLPPSLDNKAIADTIKSFFPIAAAANSTSPSSSPPAVGYQSYPLPLLSRTGSHTQDLRLSLQSFQDPIFHHSQPSHHHYQHHPDQNPTTSPHNSLLASSARLSFDAAAACWAEQNRQMASWSMAEPNGGGGLGEIAFALPPPQPVPAGPCQFFSQRGPLQSSNSPSVRGWAEPDAELQMHSVLHPSASPSGYASEAGYSGFCMPARIQGVEEHDGISDKPPPSASSASRHWSGRRELNHR